MIPKVLGLFLAVSYLQAVFGAGYSKIYVTNGADVVPVEYVNYGAPGVYTNRQIAALSAPPIGSALPLISSCIAPCVVPTQAVESLAPVPSNAKIISYKAPSVPTVVVPTDDEKTSYEYSYVVYDENTGDRKAQRELSDGSVVHGEYSFIQPDGYIREVKYTADDQSGFNAVVKSFLPESVYGSEKNKPEAKTKVEPPPCKETNSAALKIEPEKAAVELLETISVKPDESNNVEGNGGLTVVPVGKEPTVPKRPAKKEPEQPKNTSENAPKYEADIGESHHDGETPDEHAKHSDLNAENPSPPNTVELIQIPDSKISDEKTQTHEAVQATNPPVTTPNALSAYNDIIRCIQAAIANKSGNAPNISPLTYIILPGANKPC